MNNHKGNKHHREVRFKDGKFVVCTGEHECKDFTDEEKQKFAHWKHEFHQEMSKIDHELKSLR